MNIVLQTLGDLCISQPKSKIKAGDGLESGRYKFYTSSNIQNKFCNDYQFDMPALIFGTGGNASIHYCEEPFSTSTDCIVLYAKDETVNLKAIYRYLENNMYILDEGFHGAGLKHISKSYLLNIPISSNVFDLSEKAVVVLDKISVLIEKHKQQLDKLDLLIKSKFIEMFGEYDLRNVKPDWVKIGAVAEVVGGSTPKTENNEFWGGANCWITPAEIGEDSFIIESTQRKLTDDGVRSCSLRLLPVGTVLLSSRAPIGKVAIAGVEMYCNQGFKNLICSKSLNSIYVYYLLKFNSDYLNALGRGATFKEISKAIVENVSIPVPPIEIQNKFARFVEQTNKSKNNVKQSLEKLETLKKALMQKYFG